MEKDNKLLDFIIKYILYQNLNKFPLINNNLYFNIIKLNLLN